MSCQHLDNLLSCLCQLEKETQLSISYHDLQIHLKLIRMIFRWADSWTRTTVFIDWVQAVETHVAYAHREFSDLLKPGNHGTGKIHSTLINNMLMNIRKHSSRMVQHCRYYMKVHSMSPFFGTDGGLVIDDLVNELLDPLLENMKILSRDEYKGESLAIYRSLALFRNYLALSTTDSDNLFNFIEILCENALFVCCIFWFGGEGEMYLDVGRGTILGDFLLKIRLYMPMIRSAYSRALRTSSLEDQNAASLEFQVLGAVDCLLSDIGTQNLDDRTVILVKGLRFVENILVHTSPSGEYRTQLGRFSNLLAQIGCLAKEVNSMVQSAKTNNYIPDELNAVISELLNCINNMKADIRQDVIPRNSSWYFPRTLKLDFVDFFLQNLEVLLHDKADRLAPVKLEAETILSELLMLRSLLGDALEQHKNVEVRGLKQIEELIVNVSHKAEFLVDSLAVCTGPAWFYVLSLSEVVDEIKILKMEATQICEDMRNQAVENDEEEKVQVDFNSSSTTLSLRMHSPDDEEEEMVGFDDESEKLRNRLQRGTKQLDIISIVGMPGLGKTTLANKLYKSLTITSYFHLRSWCRISQVYTRRGLLLDILYDIVELNDTKVQNMSDDDLAELLCKSLKGRRYLVVLDDIWSIDAWRNLSICFPDQTYGSRILFTSRSEHVCLLAKPDSSPINLNLLSNMESWLLLKKRVFKERNCPQELSVIGEKIAEYCKGLPLSVVVVAGILKDVDQTVQQWNEIAESVKKHNFDEEGKITSLLEMSFQHLPEHLKPCFLYFGMFPEDTEISVQKLGWLWRAEGLVQKINGRNLDDVAEGYLKDLIGRSLVIVTKRKSRGGVKACHLHDLLLQFCLNKAEEENFLIISPKNVSFAGSWTDIKIESHYSSKDEPQRVCIHEDREAVLRWRPYNYPHARSLLYFNTASERSSSLFPNDLSFLFHTTNLLRVLDLAQFNLGRNFPMGLEFLTHLRYLAICGEMVAVRSSMQQLCNLETFILKGMRGEVTVPRDIWKLRRLRHLLIRDRVNYEYPEDWDVKSFASVNMESLATPSLCFGEDSTLSRFPSLRKLRCIFMESWDLSSGCNRFPVLDFLSKLESLKVFYYGKVQHPCSEFNFPLNLKKLSLSKFRLPWSQISEIGRLPNLEVLKLLFKSFEGDTWDVNDKEFLNLKFLKLETLDISRWNMCSYPFPCLQHLVLRRCKKLESIPSEIGYVPTLQKIEVRFCSCAAAKSAQTILKEQLEMGNSDLQVHIHHLETGFGSMSQV